MSIETQHTLQSQEAGQPGENSLAQRLDENTRAQLQAVVDMHPNKSVLLPAEMQELMHTLDTGEDGGRTRAGEVIAIRKFARNKLASDTSALAEGTEATIIEYPVHDTAPTKQRRSSHVAGPSPYTKGDGMITVTEKATLIESGGTVTSGTGLEGKSRRATRAAATPKRADAGTTHRRDEIADLITLDKSGRARYESGVAKGKNNAARNIKGRFVTTHELDTIDANQELIRDGLAGRNEILMPATQEDSNSPVVLERPDQHPLEDWDTRSDKHKRIIKQYYDLESAKEGAAQAEIETSADRTFGIWTKEQEAAIEYLKRPIAAQEKRTLLRTIAERSKKSDELLRPENHPIEDWDTRSDQHKRIIMQYYGLEAAKNASTLAKDEKSVTPEVRIVTIRKKALAAALAGSLLLGAAVGKWIESDGDSPVHAATSHAKTVDAPANPATVKTPARHEAKGPASVHLKRGDNPWHEAEIVLARQGINHPSDAQIDKETDHLRAINGHMTEAQAKHLPVGFSLKLR